MSKPGLKPAKTREAILDAADRVIRRAGSAGLTIDAVALEADLSKGGVLHHFASKDALIAAMVAHQLACLQAAMAEFEDKVDPGPAAPLRAVIEHARDDYMTGGFPPALMAASVESPTALDGYRLILRGTLERLEQEPGRPNGAVVLFFAMLGLFLTKSLTFHAFDAAQTRIFLDTVAAMTVRLEREGKP